MKMNAYANEQVRYVSVEGDMTFQWKRYSQTNAYILADEDQTLQSDEKYVYYKQLTVNDGDTKTELAHYAAISDYYRLVSASIEFIPLINNNVVQSKGIMYVKYLPAGSDISQTQPAKSAMMQNQQPITLLRSDQSRRIQIQYPSLGRQYAGQSTYNEWRPTTQISSGLPVQVGILFYQTDTPLELLSGTALAMNGYRIQCRFKFAFRGEKFTGSANDMNVKKLNMETIEEIIKDKRAKSVGRMSMIKAGLKDLSQQVTAAMKLARDYGEI